MQSIIITGAGSGLGRELALLLAKKNYHVILTGRNTDKLIGVKEEIETLGGKAAYIGLDVRKANEAEDALKELSKKHQIYGLINNAGVGHFGSFVDIKEAEITDMLDTNVLGTIFMTKAFLSHLPETREGHVVNIISTAGLRGKVNEAVYAASKFAVKGFTESLQKEYKGTAILFTSVYMGGMATPFWEESDHIKDPSRLRSPREIAEIIISQMDQEEIIIENENKK
ncbi:MAG: SDR family oxidoreductase [Bacillota bacterium]|nr:SDR family oxidoreductase [Bacillota bacterium]MDP4170973.1 SDR family oxidoreductase [Bacillota bacterium]